MSELLAVCENYSREYSIFFSALKSKCRPMVTLPKNCRNTFKRVNDCILYIDSSMIDHVQFGLPFQTHDVLLPLVSQCLPVLDEIFRCSLNFVWSCIRHESAFGKFIALHGVHARSRSLFGRRVVYCAERFNCSINDLIYGRIPIIYNSYVSNSFDETTLDCVAFLRELIMNYDSGQFTYINRLVI